MHGNGPLNGFRVAPRSIGDIRQTADNVLQVLEIGSGVAQLKMGHFLDGLSKYGIVYDILEPHEMPHSGVEACCIPEDFYICIKDDVFKRACNDEPRARFTIIHEFGHLLLGHSRTMNREVSNQLLKTYEDSEWQANQFAAEFLMPLSLIKQNGFSNVGELESFFNVSRPAAERRMKQLKSRGEL
jgi:hypothetical protein